MVDVDAGDRYRWPFDVGPTTGEGHGDTEGGELI